MLVSDPHVASFKYRGQPYDCIELTEERLQEADITVITTDHSGFDYEMISSKSQVLFDTRNALHQMTKPDNYHLL
ncbi:UDP-N-acetyl-D-glucosamine 6-dehydrogenase [compost metagenome]